MNKYRIIKVHGKFRVQKWFDRNWLKLTFHTGWYTYAVVGMFQCDWRWDPSVPMTYDLTKAEEEIESLKLEDDSQITIIKDVK